MSSKKDLKNNFFSKVKIAWLFIGIVFLWLISPFALIILFSKWEIRGQLGDSFGVINSLFSGLAFAGLIITISLQRSDLRMQKRSLEEQIKELQLQREETKLSTKQLDEQRKLINFQIIQSTVNQLIERKNECIIDFKVADHEGKRGLHLIAKMWLSKKVSKSALLDNLDRAMFDSNKYKKIFLHILNYILESDISEPQKELLISQFNIETSDIEILLVYKMLEGDLEEQHNLLLLKRFGFYDRLVKIEQLLANL